MAGPSTTLREYWASAPEDEIEISTVELAHAAFGVRRFAQWASALTARIESGQWVDFEGVGFEIDMPAAATELIAELRLSLPFVPELYNILSRMTPEQLDEPLTAKVRTYLASDLTAIQILPAPVYQVSQVVATVDELALDLQAGAAASSRAGRYFSRAMWPTIQGVRVGQ